MRLAGEAAGKLAHADAAAQPPARPPPRDDRQGGRGHRLVGNLPDKRKKRGSLRPFSAMRASGTRWPDGPDETERHDARISRLERDDVRSTRIPGSDLKDRGPARRIPRLRNIRPSFSFSTDRHKCFRARRGADPFGRPPTPVSRFGTGEKCSCYFHGQREVIFSGVRFKLLKHRVFSSLELAEERTGLRCSSLLPGRNRKNSPDQGARRPIENRALRGAGQGNRSARPACRVSDSRQALGRGGTTAPPGRRPWTVQRRDPRFDPITSRSSSPSQAQRIFL